MMEGLQKEEGLAGRRRPRQDGPLRLEPGGGGGGAGGGGVGGVELVWGGGMGGVELGVGWWDGG